MSRVVAFGEGPALEALALAGVEVHSAGDGAVLRERWAQLSGEVGLVLLTSAAHAELAGQLGERPGALVVVLP